MGYEPWAVGFKRCAARALCYNRSLCSLAGGAGEARSADYNIIVPEGHTA